MQIGCEFAERVPAETGHRHLRRIVIDLDPEDDPTGMLTGLVMKGRLEAFLRLFGNPGAPADRLDAGELLRDFGFVANVVDTRYGELWWVAKDTLGMSWRQIANACEVAPTSVRNRVKAVRRDYADEHGMWRDADGLHEGTVAEARGHAAAATRSDERGTANVVSGQVISVVGIINDVPDAPGFTACIVHDAHCAGSMVFGPDPFASGVDDDDTPVWLCEHHRELRRDEV